MDERPVTILSLVERGWQAAREVSLELPADHVRTLHIVKGRLSRPVKSLIAPKPNVRVISLHPQLFWPAVVWLIAVRSLGGRPRALLVDNDRSYRRLHRWARLAHMQLTIVRQGSGGYELWVGSQRMSQTEWRSALR